jgi:hypothetical protein
MVMKTLMSLIALLMTLCAGCESYTWLLYENPSLSASKQGEQCFPDPLGLGRSIDLTGNEAMRRGTITKVKSIEYRVAKFHGLGKECVVAQGE